MRISLGRLLAALVLTLTLTTPAHASPFTFFDGTFSSSDWTVTDLSIGTGLTYSQTVTQNPIDGNPDFNRQVQWSTIGELHVGDVLLKDVRHLNTVFSYDPATMGAIASLTIAFDAKSIGSVSSYRAVLEQDGIFYSPVQTLPFTSAAWTTMSLTTLAASEWDKTGTAATGTPDFSATGGVIRFGFRNGTSTTCSGAAGESCGELGALDQIDNFSVSVTSAAAVPEPASMLLLGCGLVVLFASRRRR